MKTIQNDFPKNLPDNTYVAIDTEWFGMNKHRMHRPDNGKFACITMCWRPGEVYLIQGKDTAFFAIESIQNCVWVMHNAKFDLTHMRRLAKIPPRNRVIDTMMMDRILWNGLYESFSLQDLVRRYLHEHLDKNSQEDWATATEMTPEMVEYSVKDADATLRVWLEQRKQITRSDMQVFRKIDLPTMWAVMDFRGFGLDVEGWRSLAEDNKFHAQRLEEQLDFNPRSSKQVVEKLRSRGFKGIESSGADVLEKFIAKYPDTEAAKQAEIILGCREYSTFSSRYGKRWLEDYLEQFSDGSAGFVGDYWIIGAETGRMSARNPPLHQIPSRSTKVFREKFIARPNHKLIICDYSQQEIVIMAYVTQDPVMMEVCNSGKDAYIMMAKVMYNLDITKKDPLRKRMKSVVLGIDYGMTEQGLAAKENISTKEAAEVIMLFRKKFHKAAAYMDRMTKEKTYVQTVSGRKYWLNPYSSQCYRNALNSPIQGCLHGDTLVLTRQFGIKKLCDLYNEAPKESPIDIWDGCKYVKAQVAYSGKKQMVNIHMRGGITISCSKDHKFLTMNSASSTMWKIPSQFSSQQWIKTNEKEADSWDTPSFTTLDIAHAHNANHYNLSSLKTSPFDLGVWLGRVCTDGNISDKCVSLFVAEHEVSVLPYLKSLSEQVGKVSIRDNAEYKNKRLGKDFYKPMYQLCVWSKNLAHELLSYNAPQHIPTIALENKEILRGYLRGIFDGDATVNSSNIVMMFGKGEWKKTWAREIQFALSLFGIRGRITYLKDRIHLSIMKQDCHIFAEKIGFINSIKQEKATKLISAHTHNAIYGKSIKVRRVEHTNEMVDMYDIINSESGMFIANGLITHNSAADITKLAIAKIHQGWKWDCEFGIVNVIHDEIVLDVPEELAEEIRLFVQETMIAAAEEICVGMKFRADAMIANTWAEKE